MPHSLLLKRFGLLILANLCIFVIWLSLNGMGQRAGLFWGKPTVTYTPTSTLIPTLGCGCE